MPEALSGAGDAVSTGLSKDCEADHRIGNSLAFLSAMLRFESRRITSVESARLALLAAASRLNAVSRAHFALARHGDSGEVPLPHHLSELATNLSESLGIDIEPDCDDVTVSAELAGGLAVVISELATNSVKHAGANQRVAIKLAASIADNDRLRVVISDNGNGMPDGFEFEDTTGLGMTIITSTIRRLNGSLNAVPGNGATFRIEFPLRG